MEIEIHELGTAVYRCEMNERTRLIAMKKMNDDEMRDSISSHIIPSNFITTYLGMDIYGVHDGWIITIDPSIHTHVNR